MAEAKYTGTGTVRIGDNLIKPGEIVDGPGELIDALLSRNDFEPAKPKKPTKKKSADEGAEE